MTPVQERTFIALVILLGIIMAVLVLIRLSYGAAIFGCRARRASSCRTWFACRLHHCDRLRCHCPSWVFASDTPERTGAR